MRSRASSAVILDPIFAQVEIAEIAKLSHNLARNLEIIPSKDGSQATLTSRENLYLEKEIAALVGIESVASDSPVNVVLERVRADLEARHFPMDKKPSDARQIGSGHHSDE